MNELVFEVIEEADGGYCAECLTESIVTEGNSWDGLRANVREAVRGYYFDQPEKLAVRIRLRLVRDEVLAAWKSRATSLAAVKHWNYNASRFEITAPCESAQNARYGLTAASEMLRHADVAVTAAHDVENKKRSALGFGHLLKSERTIIPIRGEAPRSQAINEQRREFMRRLKLL